MAQRNTSSFIGFLVTCFVVVGLTGLFALYAVPIPLERAMARDRALDEVLLSADNPGALAALRPRLDTSADAVLSGPGTLTQRVTNERQRMHAQLLTEDAEYTSRIVWLIAVITILAAAFGSMLLVLATRP